MITNTATWVPDLATMLLLGVGAIFLLIGLLKDHRRKLDRKIAR